MSVTRRHHGKLPIKRLVGCKGDTTDTTGEFPEAIYTGGYYELTLLFVAGWVERLEFSSQSLINKLKTNKEKQRMVAFTIRDRSFALIHL